MPTVLIQDGFRFFFYSNDHLPMHIHVEKQDGTAKFDLDPLQIVKINNFSAADLRRIRKIIEVNIDNFKQRWDEHFNF